MNPLPVVAHSFCIPRISKDFSSSHVPNFKQVMHMTHKQNMALRVMKLQVGKKGLGLDKLMLGIVDKAEKKEDDFDDMPRLVQLPIGDQQEIVNRLADHKPL